MRAEFNYELTKDEYAAGLALLMEQLRHRDSEGRRRLWEQLAVVLATILMVAFFFPAGVFALLLAAFLLSVAHWSLRRRWLRNASGISFDPVVSRIHVELTDEGIVERTKLRERHWIWAAVRQVHDTGKVIVLELAGWDMLVLPTRLWSDVGQRKAFIGSLPADVTLAERPRPNQDVALRQGFHATMEIAAMAAAVDGLGIFAFTIPVLAQRLPNGGGSAEILAVLIGGILMGCGFAYAAFNLVRSTLPRLHEASPTAATAVAAALTWVFPVYLLADYFGWI